MKSQPDGMPKAVATAILLSGHSKTNTFRKVCNTARERVCEPLSRSTALPISAPKTPMQRFECKLRKANAKQLTTWLRRATRRGNRLQDILFDAQGRLAAEKIEDAGSLEAVIGNLERNISEIDAIGLAINLELTNRATRGKVTHV